MSEWKSREFRKQQQEEQHKEFIKLTITLRKLLEIKEGLIVENLRKEATIEQNLVKIETFKNRMKRFQENNVLMETKLMEFKFQKDNDIKILMNA